MCLQEEFCCVAYAWRLVKRNVKAPDFPLAAVILVMKRALPKCLIGILA
jgi:hypothetical protein